MLNRESEILLLISGKGDLLFLNSSASRYFKEINIQITGDIYSLLSLDSQEVLRKNLNEFSSFEVVIHSFLGIIETEHVQIPVHVWLRSTATSQEDVFILIVEPIRKNQSDPNLIKLYKAVADYSPDIVSVYDEDLNCIYVNRNAYRQLGHGLGSYYTNSGFLQFVDPPYRSVLLSDIEK
ncbi:MAG: PAS domain-containing protein, partial [Bacteroidota bacterium]